mgnify:CR=1 FL=1
MAGRNGVAQVGYRDSDSWRVVSVMAQRRQLPRHESVWAADNERLVERSAYIERCDADFRAQVDRYYHRLACVDDLLSVDDSLLKLDTDYLDLYLIHWPNPVAIRDHWAEGNAEAWRAMEEAVQAGKIRAIGVSNFRRHHLEALLKTAEIKPVVNQICLNPNDLQAEVTAANKEYGLLSEAYSPLGTGGLLGNETIKAVGAKYGKSSAQVLIRWSLQHNFLPLPKSVHPDYIKANAEVFDFALTADDMAKLDGLQGIGQPVLDPDQAEFYRQKQN